ncbi:HAO1 (predicted) [Pycnogonum litorale]
MFSISFLQRFNPSFFRTESFNLIFLVRQIEVLPEVVKAVDGRCEVYLDGGVRTGTDILKAIALGARAVFVGRPMLWGLVHDGQEGGRRILEILKKEVDLAMALSGCARISDIDKNLVVRDSFYSHL